MTYKEYLSKYNVKDAGNPLSFYDYEGAYKAGIKPIKWKDLPKSDREEDLRQIASGERDPIGQDDYMWPDEFKLEGHPVPANDMSLDSMMKELDELAATESSKYLDDLDSSGSLDKRMMQELEDLARHEAQSINPVDIGGRPPLSGIEKMYRIEKAQGTLNRIFVHLNSTVSGIGTIATLSELGKKKFIQDSIANGTLKLSEEDAGLILNSLDEDWEIIPDPAYTKRVPPHASANTKKIVPEISIGGYKPENFDLYAKVTVKKETETKKRVAPIKTVVKYALGQAKFGEVQYRKEKEKLISIEQKEIKLGDFKLKNIEDWLKINYPDILNAAYKSSVNALRGHATIIPMTTEEGKTPLTPGIVSAVKASIPRGAPGRKTALVGAVALETAIPSPEELLAVPISAGLKIAGSVDNVAKITGKLPQDMTVSDTVFGLIGQTDIGKAMYKGMNNWTPSRYMMRWFGQAPEKVSEAKKAIQMGKGVTGVAEKELGQEIIDLSETMFREVPQLKKQKIWNPKTFKLTLDKLKEWFYGRASGSMYLKDYLKFNGTVDDFFNDTKNLSQLIDVPEDWLTKYISITDIRQIITAIESGSDSLKDEIGEESAKLLRKILDDTARAKYTAGLIGEEALEKYTTKDGVSTYVHHAKVTRQTAPQKPFSTTAYKPGFTKGRKEVEGIVNETWQDFERAALTSDAPSLPQYNLFETIMDDAEEAFTFSMQNGIENRLIQTKSMARLKLVTPITDILKAKQIVKKYKNYLTDIYQKATLTTENIIDAANDILRNPKRITDDFELGRRTIPVLDLPSLETNLKQQVLKIWESRFSLYYPKSKMRIYPMNVRREIEISVKRGLVKLTDSDAEKVNSLFEILQGVGAKEGDLTAEDMVAFYTLMQDEVMKKIAPKTAFAVTRKVPVFITPREVGDLIKSEVRTVTDPYIRPALKFLRKLEQPFMSAVTSYNINFWRKTLMTNVFQMWNGGVPLYRIPGRLTQAALVSSGKGITRANGVEIANDLLRKEIERTGVKLHIRSLMSANNFNAIQRSFHDVFYHSVLGRKINELFHLPDEILSHLDDYFRVGAFVDFLDKEAAKRGYKTVEQIMSLTEDAARYTWKHFFNYGDLPNALKNWKVAVPFLSWKYNIIPDQIRFLFNASKMRRLANGTIAMQNAIEPPATPIAQDYINKSPELKWENNGKVYRLITNLPYMNVLDFKEFDTYTNNMIASTGPLAQFALSLAGYSTYPELMRYKDMSPEQSQVPMPISMFTYWKGLNNQKWFQKMTNMSLRIDSDEYGKSTPYLTVSKQWYDIWHQVFPYSIPIDENTKNIKLFIDENDVKFNFKDPKEYTELSSEYIKKEGVASFTQKKHAKPIYLESRPNYMVREVDVAGGWKREYARMLDLEKQLNGYDPYTISSSLKTIDIKNLSNTFEKMLYEFMKTNEDLQDFLDDNPEGLDTVQEDLRQRAINMQLHADTIRKVISVGDE